jgi:glycosyltransferase involved in cell wall biosynthesis
VPDTASKLVGHPPEASVTDLLILIPALNEEATIASVVGKALDALDGDVLVIDDGSEDLTARRALDAGARVLQHPFNLGVGAAIRTGIRHANEEGYDRVVQIDADGQHEPTDAARLLARLDDGFDLVVGSRFAGDDPAPYEVGIARRASMRLLARVASRHAHTVITDATSGFRAFGPAALELFGAYYPSAYLSDTVEALLIGGDADLRICEEGVHMHQRQGGVPSARPLRSLIYLVRLNLVILVHRRRTPPRTRAGRS